MKRNENKKRQKSWSDGRELQKFQPTVLRLTTVLKPTTASQVFILLPKPQKRKSTSNLLAQREIVVLLNEKVDLDGFLFNDLLLSNYCYFALKYLGNKRSALDAKLEEQFDSIGTTLQGLLNSKPMMPIKSSQQDSSMNEVQGLGQLLQQLCYACC